MIQYLRGAVEDPNPYPRQKTLNLRGRLFSLETPQVMGIINVTPDSFYKGSRREGEKAIRERIEQILKEGGSIIDIGGCSTRPGAVMPNSHEEMERLRPVLKILCNEYPQVAVSVDTFRAEVASMSCLEYGVHIINDISGGEADPLMFETVARLGVPYILMHLRGGIESMHSPAPYQPNVETAVADYYVHKIEQLRSMGVKDIILDPGYGFSKLPTDNYRLLAKSNKAFRAFGLPILTGISRKRMIWQTLGTSPEEALNGTTVLHTIALLNDTADILRVHDVREAIETIKIVEELKKSIND